MCYNVLYLQLCGMFLGPLLEIIYITFLATYMFGTLWAYSTVFSNAFARKCPVFGPYSYLGFLAIFSCVVIPLSCLDLKEQLIVQMLLSLGRVIMVVLMVSTIAVSYFWGSREDFGSDVISDKSDLFAFDSDGLQHLLPIAVFANILHHSLPALAEPVRNKKKLSHIFTTTLLCCFCGYSAIAMSVSLYFGGETLSSSNLNWVDYGNYSSGVRRFVMRLISIYITMFPAMDVASAFPLNAITIGNNMFSTVYGKEVHRLEDSKKHKLFFRLLAAIPPLVMAAFESNLGKITDYTGISGIILAFIFPPLLAYYSHITLANAQMPTLTIYSSEYATPRYGVLMLMFGIVLAIYVPFSLSS